MLFLKLNPPLRMTTEASPAGVDRAQGVAATPIRVIVATASIIVLALDQITKLWAVAAIKGGAHIPVIPGLFDLVYVENRGAAFGMLSGYNTFLILASVLTLVILWAWRKSLHDDRPGRAVILGVMIGGILGNLVDRVRLGYVVDFLDFYVGRHHWPAFNIADTAICVGIFLALLLSMGEGRRRAGRETSGGRGLD